MQLITPFLTSCSLAAFGVAVLVYMLFPFCIIIYQLNRFGFQGIFPMFIVLWSQSVTWILVVSCVIWNLHLGPPSSLDSGNYWRALSQYGHFQPKINLWRNFTRNDIAIKVWFHLCKGFCCTDLPCLADVLLFLDYQLVASTQFWCPWSFGSINDHSAYTVRLCYGRNSRPWYYQCNVVHEYWLRISLSAMQLPLESWLWLWLCCDL